MFKKSEIDEKLDAEINTLLDVLAGINKDEEEYEKVIAHFSKLYDLRHKSRVSKETLAVIAANLTGIIVVLTHERAHVVASKAFGLVKKIF